MVYVPADYKTHGFSVRLFRDNCPGKSLELAEVGDIICGHGKAHSATSGALICGSQKFAVVFYIGPTGNATYNRGLALAMADAAPAGQSHKWKTSNGTLDNSVRFSTSSFTSEDGIPYRKTRNSSTWPAFLNAISNNSTPTPPGTSGWFLASGYQWSLMMSSVGGADNMRTYFSSRGGTNLMSGSYWTCSEKDANHAWYFSYMYNTWNVNYTKTETYGVRSCLAF